MRYYIKITAKIRRSMPERTTEVLWVNGGLGYDENDLEDVFEKLDNDQRVVKYELVEKGAQYENDD